MNSYKKIKNIIFNVFFIFLINYLSGCGIHQGGIPAEMKFEKLPQISQPSSEEYKISPGDQLEIKFFYNSELNEILPVRPDGKISLRLIGEVKAAEMTPSQLVTELKKKYARDLRKPEVTVIVKTFTAQQIFIDGEVAHPGQIELTPGLTTWQAIVKAGGFKETATRESIILIRRGDDDQPVPYQIDLSSDSLNHAAVSLQLHPYDVIFVPKSWIADANKFVQQYVQDLVLFKGWYFNLNPMPSGF
jgi:polysaccharide biosynthesis/export protein